MEMLLIVALLASNVWLIRKVLTKPDTPPAAENGRTITGNTTVQPEAKTPEDENSIVGKSNFDRRPRSQSPPRDSVLWVRLSR